ncbi:MAG: cytochrome c biogenesis protein ResB [Desulfobacterales bacterium]
MNNREIPDGASKPHGLWGFFASVKLTVVLLLTLAATSIIGTLVPQNESPENYRRAFGDFFYRLFETLDVFDMYHSWWFQLLLLLLTVNIIVCSLHRFSATWKIVFVKQPPVNFSRFRQDKHRISRKDPRAVEELRPVIEGFVAKKFKYHRCDTVADGFFCFAEKWRWTRLGVYIVHASVVILLIGGLLGSLFGFEAFVNIAEGETIRTVLLRNTGKPVDLGFDIRCEDFDVSFYPSGMPKEYRSRLSIVENGRMVAQKDVLVNHPLRYKGINFYQSSYGELPPELQMSAAPEEIALNFTSKETGMVYNKKVHIGEPVAIPEDLGRFEITEFKAAFDFRGRQLGPTLFGRLTQKNGAVVDVILPFKFPNFDRMSAMINPQRSDAVLIALDETTVSPGPQTKRYYTGLQVTRDPGVWVVYSGFVLMIIGCIITFFMSHQRVGIEVVRDGRQSLVSAAGVANKNKLGLRRKVVDILDHLLENGDGPGHPAAAADRNTAKDDQ